MISSVPVTIPYLSGGATYQIEAWQSSSNLSFVQAIALTGPGPDFFPVGVDQDGRIGVANVERTNALLQQIADKLDLIFARLTS